MTSLVPVSRLERELAAIRTPKQARDYDAWLAGFQRVVKKQGGMVRDQNTVTLYRLLAQATGGRLLTQVPRVQGDRKGRKGLRTTLNEVGLSPPEAMRWELLGAKPDTEIRALVAAATEQLTMGAAYSWASGRHDEIAADLLIDGKYDVILADPPWRYGASTETGSAGQHYATRLKRARARLVLDAEPADSSGRGAARR